MTALREALSVLHAAAVARRRPRRPDAAAWWTLAVVAEALLGLHGLEPVGWEPLTALSDAGAARRCAELFEVVVKASHGAQGSEAQLAAVRAMVALGREAIAELVATPTGGVS